jgi:hypothetical protein
MGVDLFDVLCDLVRFGDTSLVVHPITATTSSTSTSTVSLTDYPMFASGFSRLKGFFNRPIVDPSIG